MKLVHEKCLGIEEMVDDIEKSYKASCEHHGTDAKDIDYLRKYVFVNLAILSRRIDLLSSDETQR